MPITILVNYHEVLVTPTTLDLTIGTKEKASNICNHMKNRLFEDAKKCVLGIGLVHLLRRSRRTRS